MHIVGVISDTHGLLRDEAVSALESSALIIHAGDVGPSEILDRLARIAPVHAVRGNTDRGDFGASLPIREVVDLWPAGAEITPPDATERTLAYVVHDLEDLDVDPVAAGCQVVVYGHSHRPEMDQRDGVLYFNPGSAGHRRFRLPVSVGRLHVQDDGTVSGEIVRLEV